jgi:hypothetical protein
MMSALGKESEEDGEAEGTVARRQRGGSCSLSAGACGRTSPAVNCVEIWVFFFLSLGDRRLWSESVAFYYKRQGMDQIRMRFRALKLLNFLIRH